MSILEATPHAPLDFPPPAAPMPPLDLPADRPRPRAAGVGRVAAEIRIPDELAAALAATAASCGVEAADVVLAGWTALLARTAGQARFALAIEGPSDARQVAVEIDFAAPFADLVAAAAAARAGHAAPAAPAKAPAAAWHAGGGRSAGVELRLELAGDRLMRLDAAADRFDAATAGRWGGRLLALLAAAASAPRQPVGALPVLAPDEREHLFATWNPALPVPPPATLDALFAAQAARTPAATALVWGERRLTYGELAAQASRLAARLRRRGVTVESRVAVFLDRRPELIAALLGVLEVGAAYVPLDPAYPAERLAFMLADCGAQVAVTRRDLADRLPVARVEGMPGEGRVERLLVDGDEAPAAAGNDPAAGGRRSARDRAHDLACLIYTSGSTGRPKGVAIAHSAAAALLSWAADNYSAEERAGVLAATSVCFDLSVFEIFLPLVTGGTVVLADDALALADLPAAAEVTLVNTVPSAATELLRRGGFPDSVRTVNLAGEPLPRELADGLYALGTVERVWDLYGPSEDTTYSTAALVPRAPERPVTIGRAIPGSRAWLVDRRLEPVGVGVPGELLLGGAGLARGYLGRPALTAERFVPDPFGGEPGARLYRTGDLARWLPPATDGDAGELDFLGRLDHQVKVRGFRIELGEIEAVLAAHPSVAAAVAVVREPVAGDRRIAAYWTPRPGALEPSARELRAHLASRLPAYMVPSYLVRLDALPLTPSGKIDRRGLPAPESWRDGLDAPFAPPENERQERMAALWAELLGVETVGIDDGLIALGGHSLLAARLAARAGELFAAEVPVVEVYAHPTVRQLSERLDELVRRPRRLPPLEPVPRDRSLPLSFQQRQVWFIHKLAPGNLAYNFQYTVRFRGRLDHGVLLAALGEIVRRHEVLRTAFADGPEGPEQRVGEPWPVEVPRIDLTGLPSARREALAEGLVARLVRHRFDPGWPPLAIWAVLDLGDDSILVQAEHHFIHDGWSISVFLGELAALYDAFAAGRPSPLPELPVQFGDFAVWQHRMLSGDLLDEQLAYWTGRLADPPPPLDLPLDHPRPRQQSFDGDRLDVELPPALYAELRDFARRRGVTLFTTLLAGFEALLARLTGSHDFLIGSGVANRRLPASETLIGMIVNTLALRADLGGDPTFAELLERTRREVLGAQAHPDLPLERLVATLQLDRDLSRNPLFQVMFSFHDAPVPDLEMAGLSGRLLERHNGSAKSDFNVIVRPRAEQRLGRRASDEDSVLRVLWEFSTALFDRATVEALWQRYQRLLAAVVADPGLRLSELPLAGDDELRRVVGEWNATGRDFGPFRPLHRRVAERAAAAPEATALVAADGGETSYGELAARAGRLAAHLAARGLGRGEAVAVLAGRTSEMVAGVLAVLEAGGAYLPLDPATPAERVATLVADAGARLVLVDRDDAPVPPGAEAVRLDVEPPPAPPLPPFEADPADLAYVIFTSGSTGRPKGVAVPHRGLANLVDWHLAAYELGPDDRTSLLAGLGFDAAVWELWPALAAGAALCLPDEARRADPRALVDWLAERRVTVAFLPTPVAEAALALDGPADMALRALLTGGDVLHAHPSPGLPFRVVNHYGPTEGSVVASAGDTTPGAAGLPDIGGPIANVRLLVLDERLRPVPPGVPGALFLGGTGLARGYAGRPAWTAEAFVPDPWGDGGRLYATGDRARWTRDGRLVFLGRRDGQVKVRGVRIETGEVEAALVAEPGVAAAAVAAPAGPGGQPWLVAWWQPEPSAGDLDEEALRRRLARRLPETMLPQRLVRLDRLPLTPNGKVDRRALPAPEAASAAAAEWLPPQTEVEELIAEVWRELLGAERVGSRDHFFRLGGHSLAAARLATRLGEALELPVPLSTVFERPVLADFAAALEELLLAGEPEKDGLEAPPFPATATGGAAETAL